MGAYKKIMMPVLFLLALSPAHGFDTTTGKELAQGLGKQRSELNDAIEAERMDLDGNPSRPSPSSNPQEISDQLHGLGYQLWYPIPPAPPQGDEPRP